MTSPDSFVEQFQRETVDSFFRRLYDETDNPLYVWLAISCLGDGEVVPDWCARYFADAGRRLTAGMDFRLGGPDPRHAINNPAVSEALGLSRQRQKSAWKRVVDDLRQMRAVWDAGMTTRNGALIWVAPDEGQVAKERNIEVERAKRIINRGRRLLGI